MCFFHFQSYLLHPRTSKLIRQQESQCSKNGMIVQKINVFANGKPLLQDKNIGKKKLNYSPKNLFQFP